MNSLTKYFSLIQNHPEWFRNRGEVGEIKIITDRKRILTEQKKIREKSKRKASLLSGLILVFWQKTNGFM